MSDTERSMPELDRAYEVGFRDALSAASALVRNEPSPVVSDDLATAILQIPFPDYGR